MGDICKFSIYLKFHLTLIVKHAPEIAKPLMCDNLNSDAETINYASLAQKDWRQALNLKSHCARRLCRIVIAASHFERFFCPDHYIKYEYHPSKSQLTECLRWKDLDYNKYG